MKTILVVGLPGAGKTELLERLKAQPDLPPTHFMVEQPERIFVERDLVLNQDHAYVPSGLNYGTRLDHAPLPAGKFCEVRELDQWIDLTSAVEARTHSSGVTTVVAVVDAAFTLKLARQFVALTDDNLTSEARATHETMRALLEGVFLADWVVLNKCDILSGEDRERTEQLIRHFRADLPVIRTQFANVPWERIWNSVSMPDRVATARRRLEDFQRANPSKPGNVALTDFIYRARRPFHPQRFRELLSKFAKPGMCLRGYFWLASRMNWAGYILLTPSIGTLYGIGYWLAEQAETDWPEALRDDPRRRALWDPTWGDRRQELWMTAFPAQFEGMREQLDAALLNDDEMKAGPEAWRDMSDPLPKWQLDSHHHHHHGHDHSTCCTGDHGHEHSHEDDHSECCGGAHGHKQAHGHDHQHDGHGPCCEHHHHDQAKPAVETETARP
jgi:G3E family GTPase